jgi:prolyl 4-hydroxylase
MSSVPQHSWKEVDYDHLQPMTTEDDDDDDHEHDDDDDDDDGDNVEVTSWWKELIVNNWQQHCWAVVVAIVATAIAYSLQKSSSSNNSKDTILHTSTTRQSSIQSRRAHLETYRRHANITFCGGFFKELPTVHYSEFGEASSSSSSSMKLMDFDISLDLVETMKSVLSEHDNNHHEDDDAIRCLERLSKHSQLDVIKGLTYYYQYPSIESMYRKQRHFHSDDNHQEQPDAAAAVVSRVSSVKKSPRLQPAVLTFTGFAAKFVNASPKPVLLYWDGRGDGSNAKLVGELPPYESLSTATKPGESFSIRPIYDPSHALDRWVVTADEAVLYYEPDHQKQQPPSKELDEDQKKKYLLQKLNREFALAYLKHSGRTWLSNFPRAFPIHSIWPAEYFGQKHTVRSRIDHKLDDNNNNNENDHDIDADVRTYQLTVVSVAPRVFEIEHFLTPAECQSLIELAVQSGLHASTVYAGGSPVQRMSSTRSSFNTWMGRTNMTDFIYRRAAHVLNMDEALLLPHDIDDDEDRDEYSHSLAESLQILRYRKSEEYAPHHDWVIPRIAHPYQPTRFATLLIYLNDNYEGGETVFPRAINAQYHDGITITPQTGKAVLFYNILPDGNVDDLSQHGSQKVLSGEKFAANLWIWDPMIH